MAVIPQVERGGQYGIGRAALIKAAIALVAESGLSRLTYRSLAAEAGVTHGSVQHHFESIESVLEAALQTCLDISLEPLQARTTPKHYIDTLLESVKINPDVHAFQYQLILESKRRPSLRPHVRRLYAAYWESTERSLRAMGVVSDHQLVRAVFAAGEGIIFQLVALGADDPGGVTDAIAGLRRLLDDALAAE